MIKVRHKWFGDEGVAYHEHRNGKIFVRWNNPSNTLSTLCYLHNLVFIVPAVTRHV